MANDSINVQLFAGPDEQEAMRKFIGSWDFEGGVEHAMSDDKFPPVRLLVFDDYLAMGFITRDGERSIAVKPNTDNNFFDWVDKSLSVLYHSLKIVDLTSDAGSVIQKLVPITDLDWIDYDPVEHILGEVRTRECDARKYLEVAMPEQTVEQSTQKDLYSVSTAYDGRTEVVHMRIDNSYCGMTEENIMSDIRCQGQSTTYHDEPVEEMKALLREQHPDALVLKAPLNFCTHTCPIKGYGCLPAIFEEVYSSKVGYTKDEISMAHEQGTIDRMFPESKTI